MKHDTRAHAPLPPSASHRWLNCPPSQGYVKRLIKLKTIKKRESGDAAKRGTRIHQVAERLLTAMTAGKRLPPVGNGDREEYDEALAYAEFCVAKLDEARLLYKVVIFGIEHKSTLTKECWGSSDFWVLGDGRLMVFDLKTGRESVTAVDNTQLIIYGLGIARSNKLNIDELECVIWQPNANDGFSPERSHVYKRSEIVEWAKRMTAGVSLAAGFLADRDDHEAHLKAGDWCGWCDALAVCKAARSHALVTVTKDFKPVPIESTEPPDPTTLEPDQVSMILQRAQMFSKWLEAVEVRALELMHKGRVVPGYKVVEKMSRRAWNSSLTPSVIARKLGLKTSDVVEEKLLSPSKVEKLIDNPAARRKVNSLTFKPVGGPTVVPESDRRSALPNAKIVFVPISNEEDTDG